MQFFCEPQARLCDIGHCDGGICVLEPNNSDMPKKSALDNLVTSLQQQRKKDSCEFFNCKADTVGFCICCNCMNGKFVCVKMDTDTVGCMRCIANHDNTNLRYTYSEQYYLDRGATPMD